ncbi:expansin EXLX1 family cellulose-binding protein [Streptomyces beihaiensis]|uniref:Expansin EXLX1 family cellulose-binding protein n=1 Tax=Streptomyces beihaiensis TaxID=2984495 RepID=A0ABT3U407_9ACTN|nr:expansin EXLX1 family cellulose-binding protein [Streptomyces beihaiensis]MCX3063780.1 expansin EXLX1 family cellulose-binding protein [Streptomyces beihaiensis]
MRATKHAAPRPWRRRGLVTGSALGLLGVGVTACLAVTVFTGSGTGAVRAADASAAGARAAAPSDAGPEAGGGAGATARPTPSGTGTGTGPTRPATPTPTPSPSVPVPAASTASGTPAGSANSGTARERPRTPSASSGAAASAERITPAVSRRGVATAYAAGDGNGSCLYGPTDDMMIAAMNVTDYESAKACGAYVRVRAAGGATVTVRIVNECPAPCAPGQLDLSRQAFAKLADLSVGRLPVTWTLLSPDLPGAIAIRYKTGSTKWWCGIQVIGHRNPVAALEVRGGGRWRRLPRTAYNYFLSADGTGCGGALRITDIYGQRLTVDGIAVRPGVAQRTDVQFARH